MGRGKGHRKQQRHMKQKADPVPVNPCDPSHQQADDDATSESDSHQPHVHAHEENKVEDNQVNQHRPVESVNNANAGEVELAAAGFIGAAAAEPEMEMKELHRLPSDEGVQIISVHSTVAEIREWISKLPEPMCRDSLLHLNGQGLSELTDAQLHLLIPHWDHVTRFRFLDQVSRALPVQPGAAPPAAPPAAALQLATVVPAPVLAFPAPPPPAPASAPSAAIPKTMIDAFCAMANHIDPLQLAKALIGETKEGDSHPGPSPSPAAPPLTQQPVTAPTVTVSPSALATSRPDAAAAAAAAAASSSSASSSNRLTAKATIATAGRSNDAIRRLAAAAASKMKAVGAAAGGNGQQSNSNSNKNMDERYLVPLASFEKAEARVKALSELVVKLQREKEGVMMVNRQLHDEKSQVLQRINELERLKSLSIDHCKKLSLQNKTLQAQVVQLQDHVDKEAARAASEASAVSATMNMELTSEFPSVADLISQYKTHGAVRPRRIGWSAQGWAEQDRYAMLSEFQELFQPPATTFPTEAEEQELRNFNIEHNVFETLLHNTMLACQEHAERRLYWFTLAITGRLVFDLPEVGKVQASLLAPKQLVALLRSDWSTRHLKSDVMPDLIRVGFQSIIKNALERMPIYGHRLMKNHRLAEFVKTGLKMAWTFVLSSPPLKMLPGKKDEESTIDYFDDPMKRVRVKAGRVLTTAERRRVLAHVFYPPLATLLTKVSSDNPETYIDVVQVKGQAVFALPGQEPRQLPVASVVATATPAPALAQSIDSTLNVPPSVSIEIEQLLRQQADRQQLEQLEQQQAMMDALANDAVWNQYEQELKEEERQQQERRLQQQQQHQQQHQQSVSDAKEGSQSLTEANAEKELNSLREHHKHASLLLMDDDEMLLNVPPDQQQHSSPDPAGDDDEEFYEMWYGRGLGSSSQRGGGGGTGNDHGGMGQMTTHVTPSASASYAAKAAAPYSHPLAPMMGRQQWAANQQVQTQSQLVDGYFQVRPSAPLPSGGDTRHGVQHRGPPWPIDRRRQSPGSSPPMQPMQQHRPFSYNNTFRAQ